MSDTAEAIAQARKAVEPDKPKHVLRTLGQSIREYKKASILAPVFVTVEGILEILIPTIMASLIDEGITGGSMPATVKFGVILLVCSMVSLGAGFLSGKYAAVAGAGFAKNLRKDQFEKVQGFSFTNIDRFSTGSIVTRLTTDVTNLQNAYMMIIRLGVRAPIMAVLVPYLPVDFHGVPGLHPDSGHRPVRSGRARASGVRARVSHLRCVEQRGRREPAGHPRGQVL